MFIKNIFNFLVLFSSVVSLSQENIYSSFTIPETLLKNANAVVRLDNTHIEINSIKSLSHNYHRIVTLLNKEGIENIGAYVYYDNKINVKALKAIVYNRFGLEIKKFKKSEFKDVAAVNDFSLYEDSRVKYLEYTPIEYPLTIELYYETETENTAWIPFWRPLEGYHISTQNSSFKINYDAAIGLKSKERNFNDISIIDESKEGEVSVRVKNIEALKPEDYSPSINEVIPSISFSTNEFSYEGIYAKVYDWEDMGKWFNDNLLEGRSALTDKTKNLINELVKGVDNPIERAKIVYQFVQDNTRYISVQVGIGGMQPITAYDVDLVKYGDCKGLSNYTKALLNFVGVKANYTRLYADTESQVGVNRDFVSFLGQTNHVILNIPTENNQDIWLECTSQQTPFGFIGDFTDNRDVFVITPEGGKIKHTKKYTTKENSQTIRGNCVISSNGGIEVEGTILSKGIQYNDKYRLATEPERELDILYKKRWNYINNMYFSKKEIRNDKDSIQLEEHITFTSSNYANLIGNRMLFNINILNRNRQIPDRYRDRKLPLKILRGFDYTDEVDIQIPKEYKLESLPKAQRIENKFGIYSFEIKIKNESTLIYARHFRVNDGEFPKEDYESFRNFYKEVTKLDNYKIALIKKAL